MFCRYADELRVWLVVRSPSTEGTSALHALPRITTAWFWKAGSSHARYRKPAALPAYDIHVGTLTPHCRKEGTSDRPLMYASGFQIVRARPKASFSQVSAGRPAGTR